MKPFAERLKELRAEKSISTVALGKAIGVSGPTISRWENSQMEITSGYVVALAKYFGVSTDYLLGLED